MKLRNGDLFGKPSFSLHFGVTVTLLIATLYWATEVNGGTTIVRPDFSQSSRRGQTSTRDNGQSERDRYWPSGSAQNYQWGSPGLPDPYNDRTGNGNTNGNDQPDRNGGRYPNRNNGDRYPDRNGDRHPNRNGDRYHPDRNTDSTGNDQGQPELACSRCSRCKSGYCKSNGYGQNSCC